jgi:hypothetical protein
VTLTNFAFAFRLTTQHEYSFNTFQVRRQRNSNKSSSAGRRWKIVPSLSRSKSDSTRGDMASGTPKESPKSNGRKADPPAKKESSAPRPEKPLDPPSSASSAKESFNQDSVNANGMALTSDSVSIAANKELVSNTLADNDVSVQDTSDSSRLFVTFQDDFDRFMDEPDLLSPKTTRSVSFDPGRNDVDVMAAEEYLTVARKVERTPTSSGIKRPTYADFTPKSDYPRKLFPSGPGHLLTKERSPTSAIDFPPGGVTWSKTLTQQEFVTPQSAKLHPSSDHRIRRDPLIEQPKSILRKRSSPAAVTSPRQQPHQFDVRSYGENDDSCPSDESPSKPVRANRAVRVYPESTDVNELMNIPSKGSMAFVDERGRSVSPIFGASGSQSTEQELVEVSVADGLDAIPKWNIGQGSTFERNIPAEFQEAFLSENHISKRNDDSGLLSDSYVNFIEAVASVVIQTKVRQFLSSTRVLKLRQQIGVHDDIPADRRVEELKKGAELSVKGGTPLVSRSLTNAMKARCTNEPKLSSTRDELALDFFDLAAIRIQGAFRGWWVRDCLAVDNYCASMIQKIYRGHVCRCRFAEELYRIVILQSAWRRFLAIDTAVTRIYCIVRIQSITRGFLVRKRLNPRMINESDLYEMAATKIQAQWRSFACEMRFLRTYEDILVVQSLVRGWITRRLLRSWLKAHKMSASSRLQRQRRAASRSTQHANVRSERQPKENHSTPSPNRSSKRSEISPSYVHHIEYMRKTLGPEVGEERGQCPSENEKKSNIQDGVRRLFQEHTDQVARDSMAPERHMKAAAKAQPLNRENVEMSNRVVRSKKLKAEGAEMKPKNDGTDAPNLWAGRSEIEQRRKRKELEAKAKEEAEQRRKDAHAAELAELELRRQRMALKAEARKKEEEANKQERCEGAEDSNRMETLSHDEEKKESDSVVIQSRQVATHPSKESVNVPNEALDGIEALEARSMRQMHSTSSRAPVFGYTTDFAPAKVLGRHDQMSISRPRNNESLREELQGTTQAQALNNGVNAKADRSTSISRKGGIVADRMRRILSSSGSGASIDFEDVTTDTVAIHEKKDPESQLRHVTPALEKTNLGASNATLMNPTAASNESEDALDLPVVPNIEPGVKRVALTSATYGAEMRSLRSHAEQERIDAMHVIFQKAGLMSRVKKTD